MSKIDNDHLIKACQCFQSHTEAAIDTNSIH